MSRISEYNKLQKKIANNIKTYYERKSKEGFSEAENEILKNGLLGEYAEQNAKIAPGEVAATVPMAFIFNTKSIVKGCSAGSKEFQKAAGSLVTKKPELWSTNSELMTQVNTTLKDLDKKFTKDLKRANQIEDTNTRKKIIKQIENDRKKVMAKITQAAKKGNVQELANLEHDLKSGTSIKGANRKGQIKKGNYTSRLDAITDAKTARNGENIALKESKFFTKSGAIGGGIMFAASMLMESGKIKEAYEISDECGRKQLLQSGVTAGATLGAYTLGDAAAKKFVNKGIVPEAVKFTNNVKTIKGSKKIDWKATFKTPSNTPTTPSPANPTPNAGAKDGFFKKIFKKMPQPLKNGIKSVGKAFKQALKPAGKMFGKLSGKILKPLGKKMARQGAKWLVRLAAKIAVKGGCKAAASAIGASIGSVIPGLGNAVGAIVGFLAGCAIDLLVSKVILNNIWPIESGKEGEVNNLSDEELKETMREKITNGEMDINSEEAKTYLARCTLDEQDEVEAMYEEIKNAKNKREREQILEDRALMAQQQQQQLEQLQAQLQAQEQEQIAIQGEERLVA